MANTLGSPDETLLRPSLSEDRMYSREDEKTGLLVLANILLRHRAWFVASALIVPLITVALGYPRQASYTSATSFITEGARTNAPGLSGLAAQFGVNVGAAPSISSPMVYQELLRAPQFLQAVIEADYSDGASHTAGPRTLIDIYGISHASGNAAALATASKALRDAMAVSVTQQTGVVRVSVSAPTPLIAQRIAQQILAKVDEFNRTVRQGRAAAERKFVEQRFSDERVAVQSAEDRLKGFLQENHDISRSPNLQLEGRRLERDLALHQQLYTALAQAYEQAKIDEVRDTPVITVIAQPQIPLDPDPRGRLRLLLSGVAAGVGLGLVLALLVNQFSAGPGGSKSTEEFREHIALIRQSLRERKLVAAVTGLPRSK